MAVEFSLCIEMIFPELPPVERLESVAAAGFQSVEIWDWKNKDLSKFAARCATLGLHVTNMSGQRSGSLVDANDFRTYSDEVSASIGVAKQLCCPNLMLLTNPLGPDGTVLHSYPHISEHVKRENCVRALSQLARLADSHGVHLLLEPLNTRIDHPGYWLDDADAAFEVIREVNHPNVRLLYDLYHMRAMGRNLFSDIEEHLSLIGYFHAADFPGRHEPGTGTIDFPSILRLLDSLGYDGTLGFELSPTASSEQALARLSTLIA
ncbi:MAG: AP endonuclease [Candidatus Abyssobacteria bacterium SURF_17]|uniref:AP endonuclease n=1 Tax=Candidatus Abyssobacteria bacterium SURF_17 TaxID=2093361 RepID=A0A419EMZ1_9BACT|nr:MAG: AP endonuclease [Candidatus Abyssubacteria bacterium SURF_17]